MLKRYVSSSLVSVMYLVASPYAANVHDTKKLSKQRTLNGLRAHQNDACVLMHFSIRFGVCNDDLRTSAIAKRTAHFCKYANDVNKTQDRTTH